MASGEELSTSIVRDYFVKNGEKVKRDDLFAHFRGQLDKVDEKGSSKFGDIVNSLATLQNIEGEKYFVLRKARNGSTPVLLRRPARQANQRKDKRASLPASVRNFRFSQADEAYGSFAVGDMKPRTNARARVVFKSESGVDVGMRRNNSDASITAENGQLNDSGVDTAVSSLQSESPRGSRQSSLSKTSEYDQISQNSGDTGIFYDENHYEHEVPSHVLTQFEKSWMMSCMAGNKSEIISHLEEDPRIVLFKDFLLTALHWAAKQGNEELVKLLVDGGANVNIKSNGYTALHLAAIHGKFDVINVLIDEYHANVHIRDHNGKEAKDLVAKNSSEDIKRKLADVRTGEVLEDLAKKMPSSVAVDPSNLGAGRSRYLDSKDSSKLKPKLKAGASFRFLSKKQKKFRRGSDRPIIEHWDSSRQKRLQSTLKSDEKELYNMERSNSGSLFPNFSYNTKTGSKTKPMEDRPDVVDSAKLDASPVDIEEKRQRVLSRSYPESEFRNLARISESDAQATIGVPRSPSASMSISSMTLEQPGDTSKADNIFENERWQRRSYSDTNLTSFQDELATRLTMDRPQNDEKISPSVFIEGASSIEDEDHLKLKIDSEEKARIFRSGETFKTRSADASRISEERNVQGLSFKPIDLSEEKQGFISREESRNKEPFLSYKDEYSTALSLPDEQRALAEKTQQDKQKVPQPRYLNDISKFNNNYRQISEIVTSEQEIEGMPEEARSPVRPPRKKDKKVKKSFVEGGLKENSFDFDSGNKHALVSPNLKQNFTDGLRYENIKVSRTTEYGNTASSLDNKGNAINSRQSSASLNDVRMRSDIDLTKPKDDITRDRYDQGNFRRNSDGMAMHRAHSDDNILQQHSVSKTRRKSEGFIGGLHVGTSNDEFLKPNPEYSRRKSDGFMEQRWSESIADQDRSKSFSNQQRALGGSTTQKEMYLDHPRQKITPEMSYERFTDQQGPKSFSDQQRVKGYQHEVSLDHRRRRTIANIPSSENNGNGLTEVSLDTSKRRASEGYLKTDERRDSLGRVLPPYRPPPPGLLASPEGTRSTRPNRMPPVPPSYAGPNAIPIATTQSPLSSNQLSYYSSPYDMPHIAHPVSQPIPTTVSPVAPPRKHRSSRSSIDIEYPPTELSPTAPPRKHRGRSISADPPTNNHRSSRPSYPPPSIPSDRPRPKSQGEGYTYAYEDPAKRRSHNYKSANSEVIKATYDFPADYIQSQSSNYRQPESRHHYPSKSSKFQSQSSHYLKSDSNQYYPSYHVESQSQSNSSQQSGPEEYYPSEKTSNFYQSDSRQHYTAEQSSDYQRSERPDSSYRPSKSSVEHPPWPEFGSKFESTAACDHSPYNNSPSLIRRPTMNTITRDQSPDDSDEIVLARSISLQGDHYPEYSGEIQGALEYIPSERERLDLNKRNGLFNQMVANRYGDDNRSTYDMRTNMARPEVNFTKEQNLSMELEPEFIVAKQVNEGLNEALVVVIQEGKEEVRNAPLAKDLKNKWVSTSSDGSSESSDNRNKYKMTSII